MPARKHMQPVLSAGNIQLVPSEGKHATSAKRGETCNRWQAREKSATGGKCGKNATGTKRRKTCSRAVLSAGKHVAMPLDARENAGHPRHVGFALVPGLLETQHVFCDPFDPELIHVTLVDENQRKLT